MIRILKADTIPQENEQGRLHSSAAGLHFGIMSFLNNVFLKAAEKRTFHTDYDSTVLLLPVSGLVCCEGPAQTESIRPEQFGVLKLISGWNYSVWNESQNAPADFLQIGFCFSKFKPDLNLRISDIQLDGINRISKLASIVSGNEEVHLSLGIFNGRQEGEYRLKNPGNALVLFVLNGAADAAGCLIEYRDKLLLTATPSVEFEALSENLILLFIELPDPAFAKHQ